MIKELVGKKLTGIVIDLLEGQRDEVLQKLHEALQGQDLPIPDNLEGPLDALIEELAGLAFDGILGALKALV